MPHPQLVLNTLSNTMVSEFPSQTLLHAWEAIVSSTALSVLMQAYYCIINDATMRNKIENGNVQPCM